MRHTDASLSAAFDFRDGVATEDCRIPPTILGTLQ